MLQIPLAYKFVMIAAMTAQVNYYIPRMHLPVETPIKKSDIRFLTAAAPISYKNIKAYGGCIQVRDYSFTFMNDSLRVYKMDAFGFQSFGIPMSIDESANSGMERASRMKYVVNTNDIYRMATNWVVALDIDLLKMEKADTCYVNKYPMFHSNRGWVPSPLLTVEWANTNWMGHDPAEVSVTISAVSGELLELTDGNAFFSKREKPWIKDFDKLLAISDEEFLKYSDLEKSNLVVRFAAVHYLPPDISPQSQTNSTRVLQPK